MKTILVSTAIRNVPPEEPSGYLYALNFTEKKITRRSQIVEPPFRELDTNPRGGVRGSKGIAVRSDQIAITNSSFVFRYDTDWNPLGIITHPSIGGIHDIAW